MSFGIVIKGTEGLVMAAESRVMVAARKKGSPDMLVSYDNASKIYAFNNPNHSIGVVTYGLAAVGLRTVYSYFSEFEATLPEKRLSVKEISDRLSAFFLKLWNEVMPDDMEKQPDITFVIAGFDEGQPYGGVYQVLIPSKPEPTGKNAEKEEFGITWGGQREFVDRLVQGFDPRLPALVGRKLSLPEQEFKELMDEIRGLQMQIPLQAMPLQDCVDLALFFARTTIEAQRFSIGVRSCGGPIDVAVITRKEGFRFVKRKELVA